MRVQSFDALAGPLYSPYFLRGTRIASNPVASPLSLILGPGLAGVSRMLLPCLMAAMSTAYRATAESLRRQLREAVLDHDAFEAPLRACELAQCRATCCHDGAVLSGEEAKTIHDLLSRHPASFADAAASQTGRPIVERGGSLKTAVRRAAATECADDFPAHFPRTRCVFLDSGHKCTLQLLSLSLGQHPWFYKPLSCWMHPVLLRPGSEPPDRPLLTVLSPAGDKAKFASCTHCGRPDPQGSPARQGLHPELGALSDIAGRDFVAELEAPSL